MPVFTVCPTCKGEGTESRPQTDSDTPLHLQYKDCPTCRGTGEVRIVFAPIPTKKHVARPKRR